MKTLLTALILAAFVHGGIAAPKPVRGRTVTDLKVIPTRVLQRTISPDFYQSLLVSPVQGWIIVRAQLANTHLNGARVIRSELDGLYDPLALQLAKEAVIQGVYKMDAPNLENSVLLHLLVYKIADGTMVLSFAHLDAPGRDQMDYYGCARLLVLKNDKWTEIQGPRDLQGKGYAVRRPGKKDDLLTALKLERPLAAEATNFNRDALGHTRGGY